MCSGAHISRGNTYHCNNVTSQINSRDFSVGDTAAAWARCHHYETIDNIVRIGLLSMMKLSPPFPVRDVVLVAGLLLIFLHGCEIKSGSGLGTRLG